MLNVLHDLAENVEKRQAFQRDAEAFLEGYDNLTEYEKYLLLEKDSASIEGYLRNPQVPEGNFEISAAPTIVSVTAVIIVMRVADKDPVYALKSNFDEFWSHVDQRAGTLS